MLTGSTSTSKLRTRKATLVLVGFIFVFLITSVAIGLRTSNAALPVSAGRGCSGGGEDGNVTCTSSTSSTSSTSTVTTTSSNPTTTSTTTYTTTTTTSTSDAPVNPVSPSSLSNCNALKGIGYEVLAPGTQLTISVNLNGQMTFTVPSESFTWNWYFVPANGQSTSNLGQQITTAMWQSGHGQDFSFFIAKLNGQTGLVLQTDYALSQACS